MGGTDDPSNLVEVSIEQHANLHKQLWEDLGNWQDYLAWQGLSRNIDNDEIIKLKQTLGGREGGRKTSGVKKTIEHRKKMSESRLGKSSGMKGKKHSAETLEKMTKSKSDEHRKNISNGLKGIKRTPEQKEAYRLAALRRWKNKKNITNGLTEKVV